MLEVNEMRRVMCWVIDRRRGYVGLRCVWRELAACRRRREREKAQLISFYRSCGNAALNRFKYFCKICVEKLYFWQNYSINEPKRFGAFEKTFGARAPEATPPLRPCLRALEDRDDNLMFSWRRKSTCMYFIFFIKQYDIQRQISSYYFSYLLIFLPQTSTALHSFLQ